MPITQDRMIRLITIADNCVEANLRLKKEFGRMLEVVRNDAAEIARNEELPQDVKDKLRLVYEYAFAVLEGLERQILTIEDAVALAEERQHFRDSASRNTRSKNMQRLLRQRDRVSVEEYNEQTKKHILAEMMKVGERAKPSLDAPTRSREDRPNIAPASLAPSIVSAPPNPESPYREGEILSLDEAVRMAKETPLFGESEGES